MDEFDLQRFVTAQDGVWEAVAAELQAGRKTTHWMWFVFPQLQGLGESDMAQRYGIRSLGEARAYLAHPVLGPRLAQCATWVNAVEGRTANEIFGSPDDLKFHSSMTLFAAAAPGASVFQTALQRLFAGRRDRATMNRLEAHGE